jgi:NAD(P)-dependent dehydrogenase (short-subunit alcohol dehydrogenase family)
MVERGQGGRIINMAGGSAFTGLYANANHAASKGGGMGAVLTWAQELAPYDITVNALAGSVDTDQAHGFIEKVREDRVAAGLPDCTPRELGYYPPEEVASVVVWLASDRASTVTGRYLMPRGPELQIWRMATIERSVFHTGTWTPEHLEEIGLADIIGTGNGLEERLATEAVTALRRA